MSFSSETKQNIALKKLLNKAHTNNSFGIPNEAKSSGVSMSTATIFGQAIPGAPTETLFETSGADNTVEYVRLVAVPIAASQVNGKYHAFDLQLPATYTGSSKNSAAGTGNFVSDKVLSSTNGALQLVPDSFSSTAGAYEAKVFYGGDAAGDAKGTQVPAGDTRDWYIDYFSGILFQQDPPADSSEDPDYVEAYIYIGDMASSASGGQAVITGAASTIDTEDLTASRAVVSNGDGKIAVSAVTSAELAHVSGVTSGIQAQLDAKQATLSGAATTIASDNLDASRALVSNAEGKVAISDVTATEIGYLDGVSSNLQTQLDAKQATLTNAQIKTAYESNADTNAFTDALSTKLGNIEAAATSNSAGTGISITDGAISLADDAVTQAKIADAAVQPEHLNGMKGSVWEKLSGTSTVVPTTTIRGHCGAWTLDVIEAVLHQLNMTTFPSDPVNDTDSSFSKDGAVWLFDTPSAYNLPDTYWESDSSGNILFDA